MLGYIVFCCFILAQAKEQSCTNELMGKIISLSKSTICTSEETKNLRFLPTNWPHCKWPCLQKGFEDMNNINPLDSSCAEKMRQINMRIKQIKLIPSCQYVMSNATCVNATSGNIREFFDEARRYAQALTRNKSINHC